jgi:hypothetical protein
MAQDRGKVVNLTHCRNYTGILYIILGLI